GGTSSGAVAGGGSYSSTKAPLTPEGKALPGSVEHKEQGDEGHEDGKDKKATKYVMLKNVGDSGVNHYMKLEGNDYPDAAKYAGEGAKVSVEVASTADDAAIQQALKEAVDKYVKGLNGYNDTKLYKLYTKSDGNGGEVADADYADGKEIFIGVRPKNDHVYITIKAVESASGNYKVPDSDADGSANSKLSTKTFLKEHKSTDKVADITVAASVVTALKKVLDDAIKNGEGTNNAITIQDAQGKYWYFKNKDCTEPLDFSGATNDSVLVDGVVIYIAKRIN
ncbi:MAG: hypothetical protein ACTTJ7_06295, partial [Treponema sp.]